MLRGFIVLPGWGRCQEQLRHNMTGCSGHTELQLTLRLRSGEKEGGIEGVGEKKRTNVWDKYLGRNGGSYRKSQFPVTGSNSARTSC